jgi:hypothetical protein
VGQAGNGLELIGFKSSAGDMGLSGQLRGIEKAPERNKNLLAEEKANFFGQLMLAVDPGPVGGGLQIENCVSADRRRRKSRNEREQRFPLQSGIIGVFNWRRDGIEQGHVQKPA